MFRLNQNINLICKERECGEKRKGKTKGNEELVVIN